MEQNIQPSFRLVTAVFFTTWHFSWVAIFFHTYLVDFPFVVTCMLVMLVGYTKVIILLISFWSTNTILILLFKIITHERLAEIKLFQRWKSSWKRIGKLKLINKQGNRGDTWKIHVTRQFFEATCFKGRFLKNVLDMVYWSLCTKF